MHCKVFGSILGLYQLGADRTTSVVIIKNCQISSGRGAKLFLDENH